MTARVRVGLLDSGVRPGAVIRLLAARRFMLGAAGEVESTASGGDALGHGTALACIVAACAPRAAFLDARIFGDRLVTQPAVVAAGLDWLVAEGSHLVNMCFGLYEDRPVLREACARALAAGVILIASAPARGAAVYPGAYPGVIRGSGDARCAVGEISALGGGQADFAGHPRPSQGFDDEGAGGASFGTAHVTGAIAAYLAAEPEADADAVRRHLASVARYHGPERRSAAQG